MAEKEKLFAEFPPVSKQKWEEKIKQDLRGAPYRKLITKTREGIEIKPFYHSDDLKDLDYLETLPNGFPYNRSGKIQLNEWEIREDIRVVDIGEANAKALHALNNGATALAFIIPDELFLELNEFRNLLKGIYFECIYIHFITGERHREIIEYLLSLTKEKGISGDRIMGSVSLDPLGFLNQKGKLSQGLDSEISDIAGIIRKFSSQLPFLKLLTINGENIHNAGGTAVQELGISLSQVAEYIDHLTDEGLKPDEIAPLFQFNFATGSSYFMEIAKNRAARMLFAHLVRAWEPEKDRSFRVYIHSSTSKWNQTIYDPYVNMLRGTTESMSAVLGGADSLTVVPFDNSFRESTGFSQRIARNTQIILKEEAHLNKVVDPAGGSYYIENLTHNVAEEAWKIFLGIEENGGYTEALKKGYIQKMLRETARARDISIATRREVLLGTNQYPNPLETVSEDFRPEIAFHVNENNIRKDSALEPFECYRGAMAFEELRIKVEKSGKIPTVFLLSYGNPAWRKARAGFASGFFACAGYKIIENPGFQSLAEGMKAAVKSKAKIIVFCSSDEEYSAIGPDILEINKNAVLVMAGYPEENIKKLKDQGITDFIHTRSNLMEELKSFNTRLGIKN